MGVLAISGGLPVRSKLFTSSVVIDNHERRLINQVLDNKEISRFMGSPSKDINNLLSMPSVDAENLQDQYFSFLGGKMVRKFEADFAKKFGIDYAISVNSATSGLSAAFGASGIGPGDEVITTCLSFHATALSILTFNSIPVFVDVDSKSFCLDPESVEKAVTPRTKAILAVHLLGRAADMDAIAAIARQHNLMVIEDCAQAPGTKYKGRLVGTIGDIGVYSFQETKNITTGEGGMVVTGNSALATKVRLIRNHGESIPDNTWDEDTLVNVIGMNYRMTELTAAMGIAQLAKLNENNRVRTDNTNYLYEHLACLPGITVPQFHESEIPHVFSVLYDAEATGVERSKIIAALRAEGIPVGSGYLKTMYENQIFLKKVAYGREQCPWNCHLADFKKDYRSGDCPVAEKLLRESFIWFYHINRPNGIEDMKDVVRAFNKVFENIEVLKRENFNTEVGYKW